MHCINRMPEALRQEKRRLLSIGGKAPILQGALLSTVIVPSKLSFPAELKELISKILTGGTKTENPERSGQSTGDADLSVIGLKRCPRW
jgi:dissimilatory sulfite reductase (desulfoviridin) alpha/beta subunit